MATELKSPSTSHSMIIKEAISQYLPGYKVFIQEKERTSLDMSTSFKLADGDKKQYISVDLNNKQVILTDECLKNQELFISSKNSSLGTKNNKLRLTFFVTDTSGGNFLAVAYMPESPTEGESVPLVVSDNITSLLKLPSHHASFSLAERILPKVHDNTNSVDSSCNSDWILTGTPEGLNLCNLDSEMHYNYWKIGKCVSLTRIYGHALAFQIV